MYVFPPWESLAIGDLISFVARTVVLDNHGKHLFIPVDSPLVKVVIIGELSSMAETYSFLDVRVTSVDGLVCCSLDCASHVLPIAPCVGEDMRLIVELCSGMGAFSSVASKLGCHVLAGVDQNPCWEHLFASLHDGGSQFLISDISGAQIVKQLHEIGATHATFLAGISCQPYSTAGDNRGFSDSRSQSLPKALQTMWLLQAPICILECVEGIQNHREVEALIQEFCQKAGYCCTQKVLHLDQIWCAKRSRWFAILSSKMIGPVTLPDFTPSNRYRKVKEVMPVIYQWPQSETAQLELSLYELTKFGDYTRGGIEKCYLDGEGVLPTVLHSAGGQLYPCKCGCRQALSISRLEQRGLFCTLIPSETTVYHENVHRRLCRYLHPTEAFYLNGGSPGVKYPPDMRLCLSAIGQCVSPLHAIWVIGHAMKALGNFLGVFIVDPSHALQQHVDEITREAQVFWRNNQIPTESEHVGEESSKQQHSDVVISIRDDEPPISFRASDQAVLSEFVAAQRALTSEKEVPPLHLEGDVKICEFQNNRENNPALQELSEDVVMACPCDEWNVDSGVVTSPPEEKPQTGHPEPQGSAVCHLKPQGLLELNAPLVMVLGGLPSLHKPNLTREQRIILLQNQQDLWGNDEILFHLDSIASQAPSEQKVIVWDPLVMSSVVRSGCMRPLEEYAKQLEIGSTVITGVVIEQHWYPLVIRWERDGLHSFTCGLAFNFSVAMQVVVKAISKSLKMEPMMVKNRNPKFVVTNKCGALTISFIRQLIFGTALVTNPSELHDEHLVMRNEFESNLAACVPRPWVWGNGDTWKDKLNSLLQEHGVPLAEVKDRAQLIIDRLGEAALSAAMRGPQPWRELKSIANQVVPMLQIIKQSELQVMIDKKAASGQTVGNKAQKEKSKGKGKGKAMQTLDPSVETGVFVCGDQLPLGQIEISKVGPNASGIVLTSVSEALPYIKSGKQISSGGLAFLIVDAGVEMRIPTTLIAEKVRFPVICSRNGEPLLIDAMMYQLGSLPVTKQMVQNRFEVVSISSCVVKIAVYRDQLQIAWNDFIPHPLRHVFQLMPCIRPCDDQECDGSCEAWHPNPNYRVQDPLLEAWGRQWIKINFVQCSPEEAQCFTIHVRLPACMLKQLQSYSGIGGLFLEPKAVDGKLPSQDFHVIWLPKASLEDVQVYKRTLSGISGLARMGNKLGVRCATQDAESIHRALKPSSSFLPAGRKLFFLLGPVPFGTLKQSVCDAVASIGWQARPVQPVPTVSQVEGVLWKVQSVEPPPQNIIMGVHGEMVITSLEDPHVQVQKTPSVVGANRTLQMCAAGKSNSEVDPLQLNDPWSAYVKSNPAPMPKLAAQDPVEALEKKVLEAVMQRLPKDNMEVDSDSRGCDETRIQTLEAKLQNLHENQTQLHQMVVSQGESHGQYIEKLSQQQHRLEQAVGEQSSQLTHFQGQFRAQLEQQQGQLDGLFQQQMSRLEELLAKKQRTD